MKVHEKNPNIFFLNENHVRCARRTWKNSKSCFRIWREAKVDLSPSKCWKKLGRRFSIYLMIYIYVYTFYLFDQDEYIWFVLNNLCQVVGIPETGISCFFFHSGPNLFENRSVFFELISGQRWTWDQPIRNQVKDSTKSWVKMFGPPFPVETKLK